MRFDGYILGASFASGDRLVAGRWHRSPLGAFADLMWCDARGHRVLLAGDDRIATFLDAHYSFDEIRLEPVSAERLGLGTIEVAGGPIRLTMCPRPATLGQVLVAMRPRRLRSEARWIDLEDRVLGPIVRPWLASKGSRTSGVTRAGVHERYAVHAMRFATATASIDGTDLGAVRPQPPAGFGFSEFPARPAIVRVTSTFR